MCLLFLFQALSIDTKRMFIQENLPRERFCNSLYYEQNRAACCTFLGVKSVVFLPLWYSASKVLHSGIFCITV